MIQKHQVTLILVIQALLVVLFAVAVSSRKLPVGVPGEWEWNRLPAWATPAWEGLTIASAGVGAYAAFAALGVRFLAKVRSRRVESACVTLLFFAAIGIQVIVPMGAPAGYDLSKWAAVNYLPGSSGYFQVARHKAAADPWRFLAEYPDWIRSQDVFHIGTHPPGLIASQCLLMGLLDQNPPLTRALLDHMPRSVELGFRAFTHPDPKPLTGTERASLFATALLTLLACAGTVVPLYLLARTALPARAAWAAAALWPLAPCANLFQPVADTAYPLLSTAALALAAWAARSRERPARLGLIPALLAVASGMVMATGMSFTLAFLPVGLIVALTVVSNTQLTWRMRAFLILATGVGFLTLIGSGWAVTNANPFVIGSWNLKHHAEFYVAYPRSYGRWLWVNPIETAIALGLPSVIWCIAGFRTPRRVPTSAWSTLLVLVLINLTGRNMGEVARLWMLFMPPLLVAAGAGVDRLGSRPIALGFSTALIGAQTLALETMIQVVYPV